MLVPTQLPRLLAQTFLDAALVLPSLGCGTSATASVKLTVKVFTSAEQFRFACHRFSLRSHSLPSGNQISPPAQTGINESEPSEIKTINPSTE